MANIAITKERYEHFVNVFLAEGPSWNRIARAMDCSQQTAKKAWETGWPGIPFARPIKDVYEERVNGKTPENPASVDQPQIDGTGFADVDVERAVNPESPDVENPPQTVELVRMMGEGEVRRMLDNAVLQVRANLAHALKAEQEMIGVGRNNLKGILLLSDKLLAGLQPLVDTVVQKLQLMATDTRVNPLRVLNYIDRVIKINKATIEASAKLVEMQRLLVGLPQTISETRSPDKPPAPPEDTQKSDREKLEQLLEDVARRQQERLAAVDQSEPAGEETVHVSD